MDSVCLQTSFTVGRPPVHTITTLMNSDLSSKHESFVSHTVSDRMKRWWNLVPVTRGGYENGISLVRPRRRVTWGNPSSSQLTTPVRFEPVLGTTCGAVRFGVRPLAFPGAPSVSERDLTPLSSPVVSAWRQIETLTCQSSKAHRLSPPPISRVTPAL